MARLNIYDRRERALVRAADALLAPAALRRVFRRSPKRPPARILCLRLERIGDLLMTLPALAQLRASAPAASIDLVVGSWNAAIASTIVGVDRVETADVEWLSRSAAPALSAAGLAGRALAWRARNYDLAINFEPDIRSNLALAAAGARRTVGFASGGGGALLDVALDYDSRAHTADNAAALVRAAVGGEPVGRGAPAMLSIPEDARREAEARLAALGSGWKIGIHVSGGRPVKQWPPARFRDLAEWLVRDRAAGIVLTGTPEDREQAAIVRAALPDSRVVDLTNGASLLATAAAIAQLDLFISGDTGPMHLATALGTPVVAIFGPSDPARYGPRGFRDAVVRIDLPCSPCNRIRLPPARCLGHTPDCLAGIETARVIAAVDEALQARRP
jgi:ADP-heptose:LPS heptosyltransferase